MAKLIREKHYGSYYVGMTAIGPKFGGTWEEAKRFKDEIEIARQTSCPGWALTLWTHEDEFGELFLHDGKWGFHDETWSDACGPFRTRDEAREAMRTYADSLGTGCQFILPSGTTWGFAAEEEM